jgi:hypothetical protein
MLHFIPLPELHLFVEFVECVTHPLILGSLKFLDGDRPRHIIMYQTPSDVVAKFLCDDVDGGGHFFGKTNTSFAVPFDRYSARL